MEQAKQLSLEQILKIFEYPSAYEKDFVFDAMLAARNILMEYSAKREADKRAITDLTYHAKNIDSKLMVIEKDNQRLIDELNAQNRQVALLGKECDERRHITDKYFSKIIELVNRSEKLEKENLQLKNDVDTYIEMTNDQASTITYLKAKCDSLNENINIIGKANFELYDELKNKKSFESEKALMKIKLKEFIDVL